MKLKHDELINQLDNSGQSPMHLSLASGTCLITKFLIFNYDRELRLSEDMNGNTEFHKWVSHGCKDCLIQLITLVAKKGKESYYFGQKNKEGYNPLHKAIFDKKYISFKLLLDHFEFDVFELTEENNNALHLACISGDDMIFNHLLTYKFDLNLLNLNLFSCLTLSIKHKQYHISEKLLKKKVKVSIKDVKILEVVLIILLYVYIKVRAQTSLYM